MATTPATKFYADWNFQIALPETILPRSLGWFQECEGLQIDTETLEYSEGGNPGTLWRLPTRQYYPTIVLRRGVADRLALLKWFTDFQDKPGGSTMRIAMNAGEGKLTQFGFAGSYPVSWKGPSLNAAGTYMAIETLEIAHTGMRVI